MTALRILIVDDSPAMRAYVRRTVQLASLPVESVFEAGNGADALEIVRRENRGANRLDIVFADLNMPVMDGEEFMRRLRDDGLDAGLPVLIITTDATQKRVMRLRELGARGYLSKPCQPEMIRLKVQQILGDARFAS